MSAVKREPVEESVAECNGAPTSCAFPAEDEARRAYGLWAYRTGTSTPWERLPNSEQLAWREIVIELQHLDEYACCEKCDSPLECPICGRDTIVSIPPTPATHKSPAKQKKGDRRSVAKGGAQ